MNGLNFLGLCQRRVAQLKRRREYVEQVSHVAAMIQGENSNFGSHGPWKVDAIALADRLHTRFHLGS